MVGTCICSISSSAIFLASENSKGFHEYIWLILAAWFGIVFAVLDADGMGTASVNLLWHCKQVFSFCFQAYESNENSANEIIILCSYYSDTTRNENYFLNKPQLSDSFTRVLLCRQLSGLVVDGSLSN